MTTLVPEFAPQYSFTNIDFGYEKSGCEHWIPSDGDIKFTCESGSGSIRYKNFHSNLTITRQPIIFNTRMPLSLFSILEVKNNIKFQLNALFDSLIPSFTILNQNDIILFLEENEITPDEILKCFTEINKLIFSKFQENVKMFVQKYDDPETKDQFLAIFIRQQTYSDDFIDIIWEIRNEFLNNCPQNDWILISTDFKQLPE